MCCFYKVKGYASVKKQCKEECPNILPYRKLQKVMPYGTNTFIDLILPSAILTLLI